MLTHLTNIIYDTNTRKYVNTLTNTLLDNEEVSSRNLRPYDQIAFTLPPENLLVAVLYFRDYLGPKQLQWVEALESGKYKQGQNKLKDLSLTAPTYCCLGVACEALNLVETAHYDLCNTYQQLALHTSGGYIADEYQKTLEEFINHEILRREKVTLEESFRSLVGLNDNLDLSFTEIAQIIRFAPKAFFTKPV